MKNKIVLMLAIYINIIIRIPRMFYGHGIDGFQLLWEGKLLLSGDLFDKGFSFASALGLHPFSGYPILAILFISFFLLITGQNIMISIIIYDLFFTVLFVISSYLLVKELELKSISKFVFLIVLTTLPNILIFSYYTSSARLPFLSFFPFVLLFLLKWNKTRKFQYFIYGILTYVPLLFIHRMAMIVLVIFAVSFVTGLAEKISKRDLISDIHSPYQAGNESLNNKDNLTDLETRKQKIVNIWDYFKQRIWLFCILFCFIIAYIVLYTIIKNGTQWATTQLDLFCFIGDCQVCYKFIQPLFDQWIQFGFAFVIFILFFILLFIPKFNNWLSNFNKNQSNLYIVIYSLPFIVVFNVVYSFYFLCFLISLCSTLLIEYLFQNTNKILNYLILIIGSILISTLILMNHLLIYPVSPYNIFTIFILIIIASYLTIVSINKEKLKDKKFFRFFKRKNSKLFLGLVFLLLFINSTFIVDRQTIFYKRYGFVTSSMNEEQVRIADYFSSQEKNTFCSFDQLFSTQIAALSGWYFLYDSHSLTILLNDILELDQYNCSLIPFYYWFMPSIYQCSNLKSSYYYELLMKSDCMNAYSIYVLKTYSVKYFISLKGYDVAYISGVPIYSKFINSLVDCDVPIALMTDHCIIWNTSALYS